MTLRVRAKVLLHELSNDFYNTTLSTEEQRHMMNEYIVLLEISSLSSLCTKLYCPQIHVHQNLITIFKNLTNLMK